ncbi:MAG TPA: isochorismatase family protein [Rhodocyclaceae bacterium]|nr:isochorismatase family protein [Rhodocyclaceae bacterium]
MLTTLDKNVALIVIDLQHGIVALPLASSPVPVIEKSCVLLDAFRRRQLPVVLVNVAGGAPGRTEQPKRGETPANWSVLIPEVDQQKSDILVTKRGWGAFANTTLAEKLKALGVTQIVLCGISTSIGVESTARQAHELGFNVTLATDAMVDLNADAHTNSIARIFPRLGETGTTAEVIALLE